MNFLNALEIEHFARHNWLEIPAWLSTKKVLEAAQAIDREFAEGKFLKAQVTKGQEVRGDWSLWADAANSGALIQLFQDFKSWIPEWNRNFYSGVQNLEAHFAVYPEGTGYAKHLDQPVGKTERMITFVLYLNPEWKKEWGGELALYKGTKEFAKISPTPGKLVLFRSEVFPHAVLPASQVRRSFTGWFRKV